MHRPKISLNEKLIQMKSSKSVQKLSPKKERALETRSATLVCKFNLQFQHHWIYRKDNKEKVNKSDVFWSIYNRVIITLLPEPNIRKYSDEYLDTKIDTHSMEREFMLLEQGMNEKYFVQARPSHSFPEKYNESFKTNY